MWPPFDKSCLSPCLLDLAVIGHTSLIITWMKLLQYLQYLFYFPYDIFLRLYLTLRGITGFFQGGVYITLYVLTTEFVGPKHRSLAGTVVWIFYTSSLMILSGLAYGIHEWRTLSIVISAPAFLLLIFWRWGKSNHEVEIKLSHGNKSMKITLNDIFENCKNNILCGSWKTT